MDTPEESAQPGDGGGSKTERPWWWHGQVLTYRQVVDALDVDPSTVTRWGQQQFLRRYRPVPGCRLYFYSAVDVDRICRYFDGRGRTPDRRKLRSSLLPDPIDDHMALARLGVPAAERIPVWIARGEAMLNAESLFGVSHATVVRWANRGRLRAFPVCGIWLYHTKDASELAAAYNTERGPTTEAISDVILEVFTAYTGLAPERVDQLNDLVSRAAVKIERIATQHCTCKGKESTTT